MPDNHDERGGDETAEAPVQPWWKMPPGEEREIAKWDACWPDFDCDHDHDEGDRILRERELNELREQLAAATARAEKAEARLAELGGLRDEWSYEFRNSWSGWRRCSTPMTEEYARKRAAESDRNRLVHRKAADWRVIEQEDSDA
jgi:hypothetical protein